MTHLQMGVVLKHLRRAAARQHEDELSDEQLLERFAQGRDESAFAALLRRHGPMVLGVCRGILRRLPDVEDAFQATFLILAQKPGCIRRGDSVGGWLHGVAYNVALKAQLRAARQRGYEKKIPERTPTDPLDELTVRELRQVLHDELRRLPDKYRLPLILCYLEGQTQEEAARRLGWPQRRVKDRLQRGREQLRRRLLKRGLAPVATLGTALFAVDGVSAAVPAALATATLRSATQSAQMAPAVAALVEASGALVPVGKAKVALILLLAVSLLGGAGMYFLASPQRQQGQSSQGQPLLALRAGKTKDEATKTVDIHGRVLDPDGKPKAGAKLLLLTRKGKITPLGVSADDGRFTVAVPKETTKHWNHSLVAQAEGTGIDFVDLYEFKNQKPVELRLVKDHAIRGRVVNTEGKPIRGARVAVESIEIYRNHSLDTFRATWMKLWAGGAGTGQEKAIYSGADTLFATTTDADGRFVLHGMGAERTIRLRLRGSGIADTSVWVVNRAGFDPKPLNEAVLEHVKGSKGHLNYRWWFLSGPDVSVVAEAEKVIRGVVTDADTGKGVAGMMVRLTRDSDEMIHYPPEAKTDAQGRYEIHGVRKTKRYLLAVDDNTDTGHMPSQVWAEDTVAHQPIRADIKVKKGVIITGKIIDSATGEALPGFVMAVVLRDNPFAKEYPRFDELRGGGQWNSSDRTDGEHAFRIVAVPGPILLMGKTEGTDRAVYKATGHDAKYPQYFTDNGGAYYGYDHMAPLQGIWNKVLEIKPGVAVLKKDIVLEREKILAEVQVQDADGKPLFGVWGSTDNPKCGVSFEPYGGRMKSNSCSVYGDPAGEPLRLLFYQGERRLTGTLTLKDEKKQPVIVKLGPAGGIKGRLLDANDKPLADMEVELRYRDRAAEKIHHYAIRHNEEKGPILTDAMGAFAFDDVIPNTVFEVTFRQSKRRSRFQAITDVPAIQVKPSECRDLGSIQLKLVPQKPDE